MTRRTARFRVSAHARSGLLCRIVGLFAQLDLPAPTMHVTVAGEIMHIDATLAHFGEALVHVVERKIAGFVGVQSVTLTETEAEGAAEAA